MKRTKPKLKRYEVEVRVRQGHTVRVRARTKAEAKRKAKRKLNTGGWWEMRTRYNRKFGGQEFKLWVVHDNKTPCTKVAKTLRQQGRKARVVHIKGGPMAEWAVYRGPKRKKR